MGQCGGSLYLSQFRIQRRIRVPKISSIILIGQCGGPKKIPPGYLGVLGIISNPGIGALVIDEV